ncbi:beta-galactosidase [Sphingobium yanoikuyae]|uniref:Beta-galactosidase n=1 Tax=Sphingobium yanoikuyae TaxID=13690 RepID=A0A430BSV1_SPHYA|nr:beta-galactosidase [Sphingobium yanoikuyae]RSU55795.1 beta-galactosidase [Sphingobium yanoikuyae]
MPDIDRRTALTATGLAGLGLALPADALAQTANSLDARKPGLPLKSGHLHMGTGAGPQGRIGITNLYLTRDDRPWLPVMGEFHFTRFPSEYWEEELLKMKAAGVGIVASYVLWNHVELAPGRIDWTGDRDIGRFVRLCQKHGLLFFLRPGPWGHAEARFGGIPDWIAGSTRTRSNDPAYMAQVERFWRGLHDQLTGLMWKDGGPIVGMQVENEYNLGGPGQGREHIAALKALAVRIGFDVPLYTVTGWDQTVYPKGEVVPVHGGYPDEPWSAKTVKLPPKENYLFRFDSRVSGDLGAQTRGGRRGDADSDMEDTPFLGAEYGGGVPVMYRRRPLLQPADVAAAVTTQVGSGVNLLGYYMFHGGANPMANGRMLEETQRSGGYNDCPAIAYDFQAPIGQYGEVNPVSAALRPLHYFLAAYGEALAPMTVHAPAHLPADKDDLKTLRWAVRAKGDSGFLFVNNHVRQYGTAAHPGTQFNVTLAGGTVRLPSRPVTIAPGDNFFWPIGMDLDGVRLDWATAQPVTRIADRDGPIHVMAACLPGPVELAFPAETKVDAPARSEGGRVIVQVPPSATRPVRVTGADGRSVRLLLIDREAAKRIWVGEIGGERRVVLSAADVLFGPDGLELRQRGEARFAWQILPGKAAMMTAKATAIAPLPFTQTREAGTAPPIEIGGPAKAAMQPLPEAHKAAAAFTFTIPKDVLAEGDDAFLEIDWRGDIGRLFDGPDMLDDAYWDGRVWRIGLKRFAARLGRPWTLTVMPLRADAPIYLDDMARAKLRAGEQVATLEVLRIVPEYRMEVKA